MNHAEKTYHIKVDGKSYDCSGYKEISVDVPVHTDNWKSWKRKKKKEETFISVLRVVDSVALTQVQMLKLLVKDDDPVYIITDQSRSFIISAMSTGDWGKGDRNYDKYCQVFYENCKRIYEWNRYRNSDSCKSHHEEDDYNRQLPSGLSYLYLEDTQYTIDYSILYALYKFLRGSGQAVVGSFQEIKRQFLAQDQRWKEEEEEERQHQETECQCIAVDIQKAAKKILMDFDHEHLPSCDAYTTRDKCGEYKKVRDF